MHATGKKKEVQAAADWGLRQAIELTPGKQGSLDMEATGKKKKEVEAASDWGLRQTLELIAGKQGSLDMEATGKKKEVQAVADSSLRQTMELTGKQGSGNIVFEANSG